MTCGSHGNPPHKANTDHSGVRWSMLTHAYPHSWALEQCLINESSPFVFVNTAA